MAWVACYYLHSTWLNVMILFAIMFMLVVSLQVHSMYWPGVSCQISGKSRWKGELSESRLCPHRCPCAMEFRYDVVPLPRSCHDRGPFMFTKQCTYCSSAPCVLLGLANCCNMNYAPLAWIKRLFSVPICCVLPEDMISGLAMQGKPVALSRGATQVEILLVLPNIP